jgi:hypothetical protein
MTLSLVKIFDLVTDMNIELMNINGIVEFPTLAVSCVTSHDTELHPNAPLPGDMHLSRGSPFIPSHLNRGRKSAACILRWPWV